MNSIEITVATDGNTTVETKGFSGAACREASQWIERALGNRVSEQLTSDFHAATETGIQHRQSHGGHD